MPNQDAGSAIQNPENEAVVFRRKLALWKLQDRFFHVSATNVFATFFDALDCLKICKNQQKMRPKTGKIRIIIFRRENEILYLKKVTM